jgi:hypothetical protein
VPLHLLLRFALASVNSILRYRDLDPESKLAFIRLRTKKVEYMIAPDPDFTLIVVQHVEQNA